MAWLSSSRHAVHRGLRIPDLRKGIDSPLRTMRRLCHRRTYPIRELPTPRIPRSDLSVTSQTQSHLSVSPSPGPLLLRSCGVHAVSENHIISFYDTVRLITP